MATKKNPELAPDEVMLGGEVIAICGALGRTLEGFNELRAAQQAWNIESEKNNEEQDLSVLYDLLAVTCGYREQVEQLPVIGALKLWQATAAALDAADAAMLAEMGVTAGESEAPTNS